jgi:two-component system, OmpR family, sensor histidine kinase MtrB
MASHEIRTHVTDQIAHAAASLGALATTLHDMADILKRAPRSIEIATPSHGSDGAAASHEAPRMEFDANHLLAIVGGDLRAPLSAVAEAAALMRKHLPPGDGQPWRSWAERIAESVATMEQLLHDLDVGTVEPSRRAAAVGRQDLAVLVGHVVEILQPVAASSALEMTKELGGPLIAVYDASRLFEVVARLVENAIAYTPPGGRIHVTGRCDGRDCIVAIFDTGIGIPESELSSIFEPFRQSKDTSCKPKGVGLCIARWIVEAHGGRIWTESQVGVGSAFSFSLPTA